MSKFKGVSLTPAGEKQANREAPPMGVESNDGRVSVPSVIERISTLVGGISRAGGYTAGALTVVMCLLIVTDIVARLFSIPLKGVLELSQYLFMPLLVFVSLSYAEYMGEHIRATILIDKLNKHGALTVNLVGNIVTFAACTTLTVAAAQSTFDAISSNLQSFGSVSITLWPIKMMVSIGLLVLALQVLSGVFVQSATLLNSVRGFSTTDKETPRQSAGMSWGTRSLLAVIVLIIVVSATALLVIPLSNLLIGLFVIVLSVAVMLAGVPIGFALLIPSAIGLWKMVGIAPLLSSLEEIPFDTTASWSLTVIPMFILMGTAMGNFGLTAKVFEAGKQWLGRLPGGLGVSTNFAGAGLAAASGSSIAIVHSLGRVAIPEMLKARYKPRLATSSVALSGTLGMLIPPSVVMVIYASAAGTPVGPQLLAGVIPGITLAVLFASLIIIWSTVSKDVAPRIAQSGVTWQSRFRTLPGLLPMIMIILAIIGGMFSGVFTPTEAGAFGAFLAITLGWLFRNKGVGFRHNLKHGLGKSILEAVAGLAPIFLLLIGVHTLTRVMALSGFADQVSRLVVDLGLERVGFLLLLIPIILFMGMFMDSLAIILLLVPILMPTLVLLDVDMIWFGIFLIILVEAGLVTPPIGVLSYVVHRVAASTEPDHGVKIDIVEVFKGIVPFLIPIILLLVFIIFVPEYVLAGASSGGGT